MKTNEFINRWKAGILKVTELQKIKHQINSTWIVIIGIALGIVVMVYSIRKFWWVEIILIGSLFNTVVSLISLYQRKKWLIEVEKNFQPINELPQEMEVSK